VDWIVFDYAGVISHAPPDQAGVRLAEAAGVEPGVFWPAYWKNRAAYDLGAVDAAGYWRDVYRQLGRPFREEDVDRLVALDLGAWFEINDATLEIVEALNARGMRLALLSNAVVEMARLIDGQSWARLFRHRLFSSDLHLAKPGAQIYRRACEILDTRPEDVLFIDDRQENVDAAASVGMTALLFTDAARLWADLAFALPSGMPARPSGQVR
jgi:putative hydrolase of the HAD superfamily